MPFCRFADGAGMYDVTPIENMFLLEYLPTAPEGFLRVYLYARMLALHPELGEGIGDVARALRMDEDAVYTAMTYWERQGLVCRLTDRPPTYSLLSVFGGANVSNPMDRDYYEYRDFNASLQALFGGDNLLSPKHYGLAYDWVNVFGFTQEAVVRMVEAQMKKTRSKKPDPTRLFGKVNEQVLRWSERGVKTLEDVERALVYDGAIDRTTTAVLKQLGIRREPSVDELTSVGRWLNEWGFAHEQILEACAETTKARTPTIAYLNSILEKRRLGENATFRAVQAVLKALGASENQPTDDQQSSYQRMMDAGFEPDTVLLAASQCSRKGKHRFEELEWMLSKWAEEGLYRSDAAEAYVQDRNRVTNEVRRLLEKCGSERHPQLDDLRIYEKLKAEWDDSVIDFAAECARGTRLPMKYIEKLMDEWSKLGVKTADEARARHQAHAQRTGTAAPAQNPALNYEQRANTDSDFGGLFVDLGEYGEGGDSI